MNYQGAAYIYNQRSEVVVPDRKGTTHHTAYNHKPFVLYTDLDVDFEFFVTDSDRKPIDLQTKTFSARVVDSEKNTVLTKTMIPFDYQRGIALLRITQSESAALTAGLYSIVITYTDGNGRTYGLYSDQNARVSYTLEVRDAF